MNQNNDYLHSDGYPSDCLFDVNDWYVSTLFMDIGNVMLTQSVFTKFNKVIPKIYCHEIFQHVEERYL